MSWFLGIVQRAVQNLGWRVFDVDGSGMRFWAFGDLSGAKTSWNTYTAAKLTYAPAFIEEKTVYNSVHWGAVREGVVDFEELSMLKDAIEKSRDANWKVHAQKVLDDAVKVANTVTSEGSVDDDKGIYNWSKDHDPTVVDAQLQKVRSLLIGQ